jgi:hypothetical protein
MQRGKVSLGYSWVLPAIVSTYAVAAGLIWFTTASAQQPTAKPPINPNWCSDVPASPPPPHFENKNNPGEWAAIRNTCLNRFDDTCRDMCMAAREMWDRAKKGEFNRPSTSTVNN